MIGVPGPEVAAAVGAVGLAMFGLGQVLHRGQGRRDFASPGMFAVVGRMGAGKTLLLAQAALDAGRAGRPVYANFQVRGGTLLADWQDVLAVPEGSLVLLDEVQLWWPSTAWQAPPEVLAWASQLRKRRLTLLWSSQDWSFVAKRLRLLTFGVWKASRRGGEGHRYDLWAAESFGKQNGEKLATLRMKRAAEVMASYDTLEIVAASCDWEGGRRSRGTRDGDRAPARSV